MKRIPRAMPPAGKKLRVAWVAIEPTPYFLPLFARLRNTPGLDVQFYFCAEYVHQPWGSDARRLLSLSDCQGKPIRLAGLYFNPGIVRALASGSWDAVVLSGYSQPTMQLLIASCLWRRIPFLIHSDTHELKYRPAWKRSLKRLFVFPVLRRCGAALATGILAQRYWESVGVPPEKVFIVPYPSHLDAFRTPPGQSAAAGRETRRRLEIPEDDLVGIYVGRLVAEKGCDLAVEALTMLDTPQRPTLLFVGDGPQRDRLASKAAAERLPVRFLGLRDNRDLPALYSAADFFLLPSREEPWGVVVGEAMASGLPVVLSDQVGAGYDLLEAGRNGFLVPAGSAEALRDIFRQCFRQRDRLPQMGCRSREIIEGWTCELAADRFCQAVEATVRNR